MVNETLREIGIEAVYDPKVKSLNDLLKVKINSNLVPLSWYFNLLAKNQYQFP